MMMNEIVRTNQLNRIPMKYRETIVKFLTERAQQLRKLWIREGQITNQTMHELSLLRASEDEAIADILSEISREIN